MTPPMRWVCLASALAAGSGCSGPDTPTPRAAPAPFVFEQGGARCVATFTPPTMEVACSPEEQELGCEVSSLGTDLMGDAAPEDVALCQDVNMSQDVLFVVQRDGAILAAFASQAVPSSIERVAMRGDQLVVSVVIANTASPGEDSREELVFTWDRTARRLTPVEDGPVGPLERMP